MSMILQSSSHGISAAGSVIVPIQTKKVYDNRLVADFIITHDAL